MQTILLSIAVVLCVKFVFVRAEPSLTVDACSQNEVQYTVNDGVAGGKAFIEGTPIDDDICFPTLDGNATEIYTMHYGNCSVTPTSRSFGTIIDFVIIIQEFAAINTITDKRYKVECTFGESSTSISVDLKTSSSYPVGYESKQFNNDPAPNITLFYVNDTHVDNDIVPLGTPVYLKIQMTEDLPNYKLIAESCDMIAETLGGVLVREVNILSLGCSTMESIFPTFTYSTRQVFDSSNTEYDVPYLQSNFSVFIPTLTGVSLTQTNVNIKITCRITICVSGGVSCIEPSCSNRRKRQADQSNDSDPTFVLNEYYRVGLGSDVMNDPNDDVTGVHIGENDVCLDSASFYTMLCSLLLLLLGVLVILCCFFVGVRRRRQREESKATSVTIVDHSVSKLSASTPVDTNIREKPVNTVSMALPRYYPLSVGSVTTRSDSAYT